MPLLALALLSMGSHWWEDYGITEQFICPDQSRVTLERNDAQALLLTERFRSTMFREASDLPGIRYRNEQLTMILRGDVLTVEQQFRKLECMRTEQV